MQTASGLRRELAFAGRLRTASVKSPLLQTSIIFIPLVVPLYSTIETNRSEKCRPLPHQFAVTFRRTVRPWPGEMLLLPSADAQ